LSDLVDTVVSGTEQFACDANGIADTQSESGVQLSNEGESHEGRIWYAPSNAAPS
jgi:hypothetical protein